MNQFIVISQTLIWEQNQIKYHSNIGSMKHKDSKNAQNTRLKLLQFSPQDKLQYHNNKSTYLTSRKLYDIYHGMDEDKNNYICHKIKYEKGSYVNPQESQFLRGEHSHNISKDMTNKNHFKKIQNQNLISKPNKNRKCSVPCITSKNRPHSNQSFHSTNPNIMIKTLQNQFEQHSFYNHYVQVKKSYKSIVNSKIQNKKQFTLLSKTFYAQKRQEQKTKKELLRMLQKKIEREEKSRQKQERSKMQNQQLQQLRTDNHTKKYMNYLGKYHAKKSLLQQHRQIANKIRQRSQSASSIKSMRSTISSKQKLQRSRIMRQQNRENIADAQTISMKKKREKSRSVREGMSKVYQCEARLQSWRIQEIEKKNKFIVATIQKTRRNKDLLTQVIQNSREKSSKTMINELRNTLDKFNVKNIK